MPHDPAHYDALETRTPSQRETALFASLPAQVTHAKAHSVWYGETLAAIAPAEIASREALSRLPLTRKSALIAAQQARPPFGGLNATPVEALNRIFVSPGPIFDPEGREPDPWRTARALHASGFRRGDRVQNCFSYHFTPAGAMFETGAQALGCVVIPAGVGNTEGQVQAMAHLQPQGYVGTPDFLKVILERADAMGVALPSLVRGHVTGGAFFPDLQRFYRDRGIEVYQSYGTADLGIIAYETPAREGLVIDEGVIVEIVRPGTGDPVPDGEVGEVVVTTFARDYPLLRFATGDLSAILPGISPCGRTNRRIRGWMGRADQTTKVKGMFVHPQQVAEVLARLPAITRARLVVDQADGADRMTLCCEAATDDLALIEAARDALQAVTRLKGEIRLTPPGSLPNDGKVIDDTRS